MMVEKGIGAALVTDDETPVPCIVTERDILHLARRAARTPTPSSSPST